MNYDTTEPRTTSGPRPVLGIAGAGRVGSALARLLTQRGWEVAGVWSGHTSTAQRLADQIGSRAWDDAARLRDADLVLLTVPDQTIAGVAAQIAAAGGWRVNQGVVHCSGAVELSALAPAHDAGACVGGFHPLQAFATIEAAMAVLPGSFFALEGEGELRVWLPALVETLDGTYQWLRPGARALYHAAAVFASNYLVTLFDVATHLMQEAGFEAEAAQEALLPLTGGTVRNLGTVGLPAALTGPIRRGDTGTVARHLEALVRYEPSVAQLYLHLARHTVPLARQLDPDCAQQIDDLLERRTA